METISHFFTNKDRLNRKLLFLSLILFFALEFLIKNFGISDAGKYLIEIIFLIFFTRGIYRARIVKKLKLAMPFVFLGLITLELLISSILNMVDIGNVFVGILGHYAGFSVFMISIYIMTIDDYKKLFNIFFYYQFVNLACTIYQYFVLGYYQDMNNGAFTGGSSQDFFCGILAIYYYSGYIRKEEPFWKVVFVFLSCGIIAILQEEKFILAEIALAIVYQAVIGKKNIKNIFIISASAILVPIVVSTMGEVNGDYASESLSNSNNIWENLTTEGAGYGFPRFGSTFLISRFFSFSSTNDLFGLGCGACENTNLSWADTTFLDHYGYLNYFQYPIQLGFLQTGWLGIILYIGFFVSIVVYNFKCKKHAPLKYKSYFDVAIMISLICVSLIWYNQTLKWYYAIMPFLFLAMGPVCARQLKNNIQ